MYFLNFGYKIIDDKILLFSSGYLNNIDLKSGKVVWSKYLDIENKYPISLYILSNKDSKKLIFTYVSGMRVLYEIWLICMDWDGNIVWRANITNIALKKGLHDIPKLVDNKIILLFKNDTVLFVNANTGRFDGNIHIFSGNKCLGYSTIAGVFNGKVLFAKISSKRRCYELLDSISTKILWQKSLMINNSIYVREYLGNLRNCLIFTAFTRENKTKKGYMYILGIDPDNGEIEWIKKLNIGNYIIQNSFRLEDQGELLIYFVNTNYAEQLFYNNTLNSKLVLISIASRENNLASIILKYQLVIGICVLGITIFIMLLMKKWRNRIG